MSSLKCAICKSSLRVGIQCAKCKMWKHNYCEFKTDKKKPTVVAEGYVCKSCVKKQESDKTDHHSNSVDANNNSNTHNGLPSSNDSVDLESLTSKLELPEISIFSEQIKQLQATVTDLQQQLAAKNVVIDILVADLEAVKLSRERPVAEADHNLQNQPETECPEQYTSEWQFPRDSKPRSKMNQSQRDDFLSQNYYHPLSLENSINCNNDSNGCLQEHTIQQKCPKKLHQPKKHRVLLLSDSHGRGLSERLREQLGPQYEIDSFVKPNAGLENVTKFASSSSSDYTTNDCVVIIGGTNDTLSSESFKDTAKCLSNKVAELSSRTNVIVTAIPSRYDLPRLNNAINSANSHMLATICENLNCDIQAEHTLCSSATLNIDLKFYTKHKLHFNSIGKDLICKRLSTQIEVLVKGNAMSTAGVNLSAQQNETVDSNFQQ